MSRLLLADVRKIWGDAASAATAITNLAGSFAAGCLDLGPLRQRVLAGARSHGAYRSKKAWSAWSGTGQCWAN